MSLDLRNWNLKNGTHSAHLSEDCGWFVAVAVKRQCHQSCLGVLSRRGLSPVPRAAAACELLLPESCCCPRAAAARELLLPASCCCLRLGQPEHLHVCRGDADAAGSGALLLGTAAFQLFSCFLLEGFTARKQGATLLPVAELWNAFVHVGARLLFRVEHPD